MRKGSIFTNGQNLGAWTAATCAVLATILVALLGGLRLGVPTGATAEPEAPRGFGDLPWVFEPNVGQTDPSVKFLARRGTHTVFLTASDLVITSAESQRLVKMRLVGANPEPEVVGSEPLPGKSNYFIGSDRDQWQTGVPHFARVTYEDVYPGVDLTYCSKGGELEYDLIVAPGVSPSLIRLGIEGADNVKVDDKGDLVIVAGADRLVHQAPLIYQEINGSRVRVKGDYSIESDGQVAIEVDDYDASRPLVIDPRIIYSTFLGGSANSREYYRDIAVDSAGRAYVAGITSSADFPTTNAYQGTSSGSGDLFVAKLNRSGSALVYCTYLGGTSTEEYASIAVDLAGNAFVAGLTFSSDFPTLNAYQGSFGSSTDGFVTKLNPAGSALVYSTFIGGSGADGVKDIDVDAVGRPYVTGVTRSTDFPTKNAVQSSHGGGNEDAWVAKFTLAGSSTFYATYLGGSGDEDGRGIAAGPTGLTTVVGSTKSSDFPTHLAIQETYGGGSQDGFVAKLSGGGTTFRYSTYIGGSDGEWVAGVDTDEMDRVYLTGTTFSSDFPTWNPLDATLTPGGAEAFVASLSSAGSALLFSTYLGGTGSVRGDGVALDLDNNVCVVGTVFTTLPGFPLVNPIPGISAWGYAAFLTKFNAMGSAIIHSSVIGAAGEDWGYGVAVDPTGAAYIVGETSSTGFPLLNPIQGSIAGTHTTFITKVTEYLDFWIADALPADQSSPR